MRTCSARELSTPQASPYARDARSCFCTYKRAGAVSAWEEVGARHCLQQESLLICRSENLNNGCIQLNTS